MTYVKQEITQWLSSNITQTYNDWVDTTTYIYEDIASPSNNSVVRYNGYFWRSLIDSNTGNNPLETENEAWFRWQPSNTYAMLDQKSLTYTTNVGSDIVVEFERGNIDTLGLGYLEASQVTIEHYTYGTDGTDGTIITEATQTFSFSVNEDVYDLWDYIYADYSDIIGRAIKIDIKPIGYKIRVTIAQSYNSIASCGFMVGGQGVFMGDTKDEVPLNFNSYSYSATDDFGNLSVIKRNVQDLVDFDTYIDKDLVAKAKRDIKTNHDEIMMFVVDESAESSFDNLITLGKISNASIVARTAHKNVISWSIFESI